MLRQSKGCIICRKGDSICQKLILTRQTILSVCYVLGWILAICIGKSSNQLMLVSPKLHVLATKTNTSGLQAIGAGANVKMFASSGTE